MAAERLQKKPTMLETYHNPARVLESLPQWFVEARGRFLASKQKDSLPTFLDPAARHLSPELHDLWRIAKVMGTKHPDSATLSFRKVAEDIIDVFDQVERLSSPTDRFVAAWENIKNNHFFTPYREFEEVFRELLELGCDESLLDYEGREIDNEWIGLAPRIAVGLLASGVIPGKDKHVFLRIPKLEPFSLEGIPGIDDVDVEQTRRSFAETRFFPDPESYRRLVDKYARSKIIGQRWHQYKKVHAWVTRILHTVARTNLEIAYTLKKLALAGAADSLEIGLDRLPIYEISIPQINELDDIDILIKTLREYVRVVDAIWDVEKERYESDPLYREAFDALNKIRMVPLIENPSLMMDLSSFVVRFVDRLRELRNELIREFVARHASASQRSIRKKAGEIFTDFTVVDFAERPHSLLRIWLARSDTALNYGMIAAEIARVFALSERERAKEKLASYENPPELQLLYGVAQPSFRGGLNPSDKTVWQHYPVDITVQGIRFDLDPITVRRFIRDARLFTFQPCFRKEFFDVGDRGEGPGWGGLFNGKGGATEWMSYLKPVPEWYADLKLDPEETTALKRIMVESISGYWDNMSKLGTLIRYVDDATPRLRARLQTSEFSRENPKIDVGPFGGVMLVDGSPAEKRLIDAMHRINHEWPPDKQPLKLSRAIKLNFVLSNCGVPPSLVDLDVLGRIGKRDIAILSKRVPGLATLIRNDYRLFVRDAAAILLDEAFVADLESHTRCALEQLGVDADRWTEAELHFREVLLGRVIEHNALLLVAVAAYKEKVPVRVGGDHPRHFFIDRLSQQRTDPLMRRLAVVDRLDSFVAGYPENIEAVLKRIDRLEGDHAWIKVMDAGSRIAVARGWAG